jgi:hypothetical protein
LALPDGIIDSFKVPPTVDTIYDWIDNHVVP